jgi:hypothetical protein
MRRTATPPSRTSILPIRRFPAPATARTSTTTIRPRSTRSRWRCLRCPAAIRCRIRQRSARRMPGPTADDLEVHTKQIRRQRPFLAVVRQFVDFVDNRLHLQAPALLGEIKFADAAIGRMVSALKARGLFNSTLIVISAKHGQSPIDPARYLGISIVPETRPRHRQSPHRRRRSWRRCFRSPSPPRTPMGSGLPKMTSY